MDRRRDIFERQVSASGKWVVSWTPTENRSGVGFFEECPL